MTLAREQWAFPGAKCRCVDSASENGLRLPIERGKIYTISSTFDNQYISKIGSTTTVSLAEIGSRPNEFWLDRFEPVRGFA
jgi:hypothetical protein